MKPLLQLDLHSDGEKTAEADLPRPDGEGIKPMAPSKTLNQMANRMTHKAAMEYNRRGSGIFSK